MSTTEETDRAGTCMYDLVIADCEDRQFPLVARLMVERRAVGVERYGDTLKVGQDLDWVKEALEEAGDQIVYMRGAAEAGVPRAKLGYERLVGITEWLAEMYYHRPTGHDHQAPGS
jgi:hypothetical protein